MRTDGDYQNVPSTLEKGDCSQEEYRHEYKAEHDFPAMAHPCVHGEIVNWPARIAS